MSPGEDNDEVNMNYNEFVSECCDYLNEIYDDVAVSSVQVTKNNGLVLKGLQFRKTGLNIAPTIYLEEYYKDYGNGRNFYKVCDDIIAAYENAHSDEIPDVGFMCEYSSVKARLFCRVVNFEKNEKLLKSVPYVECMDLAIVFYVKLKIGKQSGSVLIRNEHFKIWNVELGQMYRDALNNNSKFLEPKIYSIEDVLIEMLGNRSDDESGEVIRMLSECQTLEGNGAMYVLTNCEKYYGAAGILDEKILADFAEKIRADFFILPSSIHELILVPDNGHMTSESLRDMVAEVNSTQVSCDEVLSDCVYIYSRLLGKVIMTD